MTLQDWLNNRWLTEHTTSREEVSGMLDAVKRDLHECSSGTLAPEWKLTIAYAAALRTATLALAVSGYRAAREQFHYRSIESLRYTLQTDSGLIAELDQFRKKRNATQYDQFQAISDFEANRMIELATMLQEDVIRWIKKVHPELLN